MRPLPAQSGHSWVQAQAEAAARPWSTWNRTPSPPQRAQGSLRGDLAASFRTGSFIGAVRLGKKCGTSAGARWRPPSLLRSKEESARRNVARLARRREELELQAALVAAARHLARPPRQPLAQRRAGAQHR